MGAAPSTTSLAAFRSFWGGRAIQSARIGLGGYGSLRVCRCRASARLGARVGELAAHPASDGGSIRTGVRLRVQWLRQRQRLKCLMVIVEYTRECSAIEVAGSIRSVRVIEVLS